MNLAAIKRLVDEKRKDVSDKTGDVVNTLKSLSKPTGTGVATGIGLGTILASIGALSRSGSENHSALSNPLLLGGLGLAGGYLAGNAFDKIETTEPEKDKSHLGGILGALGIGAIGRSAAKMRSLDQLANSSRDFRRLNQMKAILDARRRPIDARYIDLRDRLIEIARRAGDHTTVRQLLEASGVPRQDAIQSLGDRLKNGITKSYNSPKRALGALNVFDRNKLRYLRRTLLNRHVTSGKLGALLALLGGGIALHNSIKDS